MTTSCHLNLRGLRCMQLILLLVVFLYLRVPLSVAQSRTKAIHPAQHASQLRALPDRHLGSFHALTNDDTVRLPTPNRSDKANSASVVFAKGMLTVKADNSDLTQILGDVSRASGMIIEGNVREARVFGSYGPKEASAVLADLLEGLDYNVMIVGGQGALRRLTLSSRKGGLPPAAPLNSLAVNAPLPVAPRVDPDSAQQTRPDGPLLGPGAIEHSPPPPPEDPQVRRERNLQRLQQMHAPLSPENTPR